MIRRMLIEIYDKEELEEGWAQAKYFVSGLTDVTWSDDLNVIMEFIKEEIEKHSEELEK